MKRVEIFKPGTHRAMDGTEATYSEAMLRVAAAAYDPALYKAPIVIGHPEMDAPAYGWVQALEYSDGVLSAWVDEVEPSLADAVAGGRYRNVSAAFWLPDAPNNPKPGVLYLRHVGFLGAAAPVVKGLRTVSFAAGGAGAVSFIREAGPAALAEAPGAPGGAEDLARRQAAVARAEVRLFCDRLQAEGRLVPALRGMAEAVLLSAPEDGVVAFAETDGGQVAGYRAGLMKLLALMPKAVEFGEVARAEDDGTAPGRAFAPPAGFRVDPARADLLTRAERIKAREGVSFAEAVRRAEAAGAGGTG